MTEAHLPVEEARVDAGAGGSAAVWRLPGEGVPRAKPILLLPGFGRRMRHVAAIARQLAANGFTVYRTDLVNHVGLSDGEIEQFTMSGALDGVRAALAHVCEREESGEAIAIGLSLSFRLALRLATEDGRLAGIVGLVGVVNTRHTLAQVFGTDFFALPRSEWPAFAEFEGRRISSVDFGPDCLDAAWIELEDCIADLERIERPIVNFCGRADRWVRMDDIRRAFESSTEAGRTIVEIPDVEHELAKNPVAANEVLRDAVRYAVALDGTATGGPAEIVDLSFDQMAAQAIFERQLESKQAEGTTR